MADDGPKLNPIREYFLDIAKGLPQPTIGMVAGLVMAMVVLALPFAMAISARTQTSEQPRIHLFQDMDNQVRYNTQATNVLFADGRAMRAPVPGTVARGHAQLDDHYYRGFVDGAWVEDFPDELELDEETLARGQKMYAVYCATCHGYDGYGKGMVHQRAVELGSAASAWIPPSSLHDETRRARPVGHLYNTITNGIRNMGPYGSQIRVEDRWAIVAYIRALQLSQHAPIDEVPEDRRADLR